MSQKKKKKKKYYPIIRYQGHQSKTIANVLNKSGTLQGVSFSRTTIKSDGIGEEKYPVHETTQVDMKIDGGIKGSKAVEYIKNKVSSILKDGKEEERYQDIRVIIKSNDRTRTTPLNLSLEDVTSSFFILQEFLDGFDSALNSCEKFIRDDMVKKMKKVLPKA